LELLDADSRVIQYRYEPRNRISYQHYGGDHLYTPDIEVRYVDGERVLIEVKNILEMSEPIKIGENRAKFEAADVFAKRCGMHFVIWVYDNFNKQE